MELIQIRVEKIEQDVPELVLQLHSEPKKDIWASTGVVLNIAVSEGFICLFEIWTILNRFWTQLFLCNVVWRAQQQTADTLSNGHINMSDIQLYLCLEIKCQQKLSFTKQNSK